MGDLVLHQPHKTGQLNVPRVPTDQRADRTVAEGGGQPYARLYPTTLHNLRFHEDFHLFPQDATGAALRPHNPPRPHLDREHPNGAGRRSAFQRRMGRVQWTGPT